MHERTTIHRAGRGPPVDDERTTLTASWRATHCLSAPDVRWLIVHAAAEGVSFDAALLELRRRAEHT